jgi:hypothetical protein
VAVLLSYGTTINPVVLHLTRDIIVPEPEVFANLPAAQIVLALGIAAFFGAGFLGPFLSEALRERRRRVGERFLAARRVMT